MTLKNYLPSYLSSASHLSRLYSQFSSQDSGNKDEKYEKSSEELTSINLLLRLANETFLNLPILECHNITRLQVLDPGSSGGCNTRTANCSSSHRQQLQSQQNAYDACFVDWTQAKLVQDTNKFEDKSEFLLSNLLDINPFSQEQDDKTILSTTTRTTFNSHLNNNSDNKSFLSDQYFYDFNLAKLTYLSISSLLSICGIIINLFIILIIIFNTKQKCSSVIRSSSTSSGHNNLLLSQLTITGLLLVSYVFIDNVSLHKSATNNQHHRPSLGPPIASGSERGTFRDGNQDSSICNVAREKSSLPASTFLPPTPFEYSDQFLCEARRSHHHCSPRNEGLRIHLDPDKAEFLVPDPSEKLALILEYRDASRGLIEKQEKENWLVTSRQGNKFRAKGLSGSIESIFIADTDCQFWDDKQNSIKRREAKFESVHIGRQSRSKNDNLGQHQNTKEDYFSNGQKAKVLYEPSLLPMLVNILASVHVWTVAALAYDRYSAIAHPLQYLRSIHASRTRTFLFASWVISLMLNFVLPISLNQLDSILISQHGIRLDETVYDSNVVRWFLNRETKNNANYTDYSELKNSQRVSNLDNHSKKDNKMCQFFVDSADSYEGDITVSGLLFDCLQSYWLNSRNKTSKSTSENNIGNISEMTSESVLLEETENKLLKYNLIVEIATTLIKASFKPLKEFQLHDKSLDTHENLYIALILFFSLFSFAIIILIPLLIITVCNISIYRIVKVHERRLSVSSGTNINNRSLAESKKSPPWSRLFKFGSEKAGDRQDDLSYTDPDVHRGCPSRLVKSKDHFESEKFANENRVGSNSRKSDTPNSNIVNRSKRLVARQDSYQIISKLMAENETSDKTKSTQAEGNKKDSGSCDSILFTSTLVNGPQHKAKLKRKISDHNLALSGCPRRSSNTSQQTQEEQIDCRDVEVDANSYNELPSPIVYEPNTKYESGGIINQLKLAGLSFAGIAIQEPSFNIIQRSLNKSSSCSLSDLRVASQQQAWIHNQQHHCGSSISRCSVETASSMGCKRSFVSLNSSGKLHQQDCQHKYLTKVLDSDSDTIQNLVTPSINFCQGHNRLPATIGTKSAPFNVVFWLILTMLILNLPHYLLVTIDHIIRLYSSRLNTDIKASSYITARGMTGKENSRQLEVLIDMIFASKVSEDEILDYEPQNFTSSYEKWLKAYGDGNEAPQVQTVSVWLSCLCRIFFLTMVPLNGWLYGIRSRLLRTKIRMVLKRYISRRQASIEISQRQRSISSVRSRDSSLVNWPPLHYYNMHGSNCGYHHHGVLNHGQDKVFRRCSSFNESKRIINLVKLHMPPLTQSHLVKEPTERSLSSEASTNLTQSNSNKPTRFVSNAIKFVIGDYSIDRDSDNSSSLPIPTPNFPGCSSQDTSLGSSLAGSSRSLMSASINSSQSTAQLLFEQRRLDPIATNVQANLLRRESELGETHSKTPNLEGRLTQEPLTLLAQDMPVTGGFQSMRNNFIGTQNEYVNNNHNEMNGEVTGIENHRKLSSESNTDSGKLNQLAPERACEMSNESGRSQSQRRSSVNDMLPAQKNSQAYLSSINADLQLRNHMRKSQSEFKCFITSAEQEHHTIDSNAQSNPNSTPLKKKEIEAQYLDINNACTTVISTIAKQRAQSPIAWWIQLKQNLAKLILSASGKILSSNELRADPFYANNFSANEALLNCNNCNGICKDCCAGDLSSTKDQCRVSLLRRNSVENESSSSVGANFRQNYLQRSTLNKKKMRSSLTLNNIDSIGGIKFGCLCNSSSNYHSQTNHYHQHHNNHHRHNQAIENNCCRHSNGRSNIEMDQSPTYLKPPNFLKLMLDPTNSHQVPFSSASALSPIKECSSNHSYASSQSSLNNASQLMAQQQVSSSSEPDTSATKVTREKTASEECGIETKLVKNA